MKYEKIQYTFQNPVSGKKYLFVLPKSFIRKMKKPELLNYFADYIETGLVPMMSQELNSEKEQHYTTRIKLDIAQRILTSMKQSPKLKKAFNRQYEKYKKEMEDDE